MRRTLPTGQTCSITCDRDGWNLEIHYSATQNNLPNRLAYWNAPTIEDVLDFASCAERHYARIEALRAKGDDTRRRQIDGDLLAVVRREDGLRFRISLHHRDDGEVGHYFGAANGPLQAWIMGEDTIQGSRTLREGFRGRGLGEVLVDLAEEVMGLPAVPHGHAFARGDTSVSAKRAWNRRAGSRRVPGMDGDPEMLRRMAEAARVAALDDTRSRADLPSLGAAVAAAHGLDLSVARLPDGVSFAWAIARGGEAVTASGRADDDAAALRLNLVLAGHYPDEVEDVASEAECETVPADAVTNWALESCRAGDDESCQVTSELLQAITERNGHSLLEPPSIHPVEFGRKTG
jgi:hypothetical protein